jgi:spore germination cell wall hydrolase CwlJ-like protein
MSWLRARAGFGLFSRRTMSRTTQTLIMIYCIVVSLSMGFLAYFSFKEFQKPESTEQTQTAPKNKIAFEGSEFLKNIQTAEATFTLSAPRKVSHKDLICLAQNIYHEARGESILGMVGVAQITLNRADSHHRGKSTLCGVVYDPHQFSWVDHPAKPKKPRNKTAWQRSIDIARLVILGVRIRELDESLYYHSRKIKQPEWSKHLLTSQTIGKHIYFEEDI